MKNTERDIEVRALRADVRRLERMLAACREPKRRTELRREWRATRRELGE